MFGRAAEWNPSRAYDEVDFEANARLMHSRSMNGRGSQPPIQTLKSAIPYRHSVVTRCKRRPVRFCCDA